MDSIEIINLDQILDNLGIVSVPTFFFPNDWDEYEAVENNDTEEISNHPKISDVNVSLTVEHVYLTASEREKFAQTSYNHLIMQE